MNVIERLSFRLSFYFIFMNDIFFAILPDMFNRILEIFNYYHKRLQFTWKFM